MPLLIDDIYIRHSLFTSSNKDRTSGCGPQDIPVHTKLVVTHRPHHGCHDKAIHAIASANTPSELRDTRKPHIQLLRAPASATGGSIRDGTGCRYGSRLRMTVSQIQPLVNPPKHPVQSWP